MQLSRKTNSLPVWIHSSRSFRADTWIADLKSAVDKHTKKPHGYLRGIPAVKIAVLDTGIDSDHPSIKGALKIKRIQMARSFVKNDKSPEDRFGHGTHVTQLLLDVAPDAQLYVAKVAEKETIPQDHNIAEVSFEDDALA